MLRGFLMSISHSLTHFVPIMFLYLHLVSLPVIFSNFLFLARSLSISLMCVIAVCVPLMDLSLSCTNSFLSFNSLWGTSRLLNYLINEPFFSCWMWSSKIPHNIVHSNISMNQYFLNVSRWYFFFLLLMKEWMRGK